MIIVQLPPNFSSNDVYIEHLLAFIHQYSFLYDHHAVNFLVSDYYNVYFPNEWRFLKNECSFNDLLELAAHGNIKSEWPTSLEKFVKLAHSLPLPRDPNQHAISQILKDSPLLDKRIVYGMSPKKQHEVQNMSHLISVLASKVNVKHVLDLGAGQGYLDAALACQKGISVIAVDDDTIQTCGAKRRYQTIHKIMKNSLNSEKGTIFHVNDRIHIHETYSSLEKRMDPNTSVLEKPWGICGLHACGNLSPLIIRQFLQHDSCRLLVNVGCCYNHISECKNGEYSGRSELWEQRATQGQFPMSQIVTKMMTKELGFTARMLACQSTWRWLLDAESSIEAFHRHFYRALFQLFLTEHGLIKSDSSEDIVVGRLGRDAFRHGFSGYALAALKQTSLLEAAMANVSNETLNPLEYLTERFIDYELKYGDRRIELAIVWTLRAMMAASIESLILMDRFQYLMEELQNTNGNFNVELVPLFCPEHSPRNMAIIATKTKEN